MADINKSINIDVNTNGAEEALNRIGNGLDGLQTGQTKIIQSTKTLSKETTTLNDGLLKNGGAMGLLSAATGGLAMDFKDAVEAIELTGVSLKGLRGAIIATGIGALAILVLELVTNWDKWVGVIDGSTAALERLNSQQEAFNRNQQVTQVNQAEEIINLQEKIRLREAEGASTQEIIDLQNELAEAPKRSADLALFGIEGQRKGLFDLRTEYLAVLETLDEGTDKYNETYQKYIDNEKAINEQLKVRAAAINDPKVRAAQVETAKREENIKKEIEAQNKLRSNMINLLNSLNSDISKLASVNELLRNISNVELTPDYSKWKQLTDVFWLNREAVMAVDKKIKELRKNISLLNKDEIEDLKNKEGLSLYYKSNLIFLNEQIDQYKRFIEVNKEKRKAISDEELYIKELALQYEELSNSILNYEKGFDPFGINSANLEEAQRLIDKLYMSVEIKGREFDNEIFDLEFTKGQIQGEREAILKRNEFIKGQIGDLIQKVEEARKAGDYVPLKPIDEIMIKEYFSNIDKINNYESQIEQKSIDITQKNKDKEIEIGIITADFLVQLERNSLDAKLEAQQEYFDKVQILTANSFSFMDQLQNEAIIKSKDLRNVLLVAQKGAEIAQVVIGTTRENAKLKQRAGDYSSQATTYTTLAAAAAAAGDFRLAASYKASAAGYATGAAKSLAQIPLNWGIAGTSIASILATTLTSWNRSSGGGGNAGGGGGASAQFNIVGASGTNQLAAEIAAQQQQPINAYVVGSDVSTQQSLDRNRITNATFLSFYPFLIISLLNYLI